MHKVAAELDRVPPAVPDDVFIELEVAVVAEGKERGISHGGELTAQRYLWKAHVQRVRGDALQAGLGGKVGAAIGAGLSAHRKPKRNSFRRLGEAIKVLPIAVCLGLVTRLMPFLANAGITPLSSCMLKRANQFNFALC